MDDPGTAHKCLFSPGMRLTLLTEDQVINMQIINVRKRKASIDAEDVPDDACVLGVRLCRPSHCTHPLHPEHSGVDP